MLLLVLLPFAGLHLVQLLTDRLALFVLRPHFQTFIQNSKTALRFDDLTTEIVIVFVHSGDFFIKLLHGSDTVALQKGQQLRVLLEGLNLAGTGASLVPVDLGLGFIKTGYKTAAVLGWRSL